MAKIKTNKQPSLAFLQTNLHHILVFIQTNNRPLPSPLTIMPFLPNFLINSPPMLHPLPEVPTEGKDTVEKAKIEKQPSQTSNTIHHLLRGTILGSLSKAVHS
jgi:hypothetical protein